MAFYRISSVQFDSSRQKWQVLIDVMGANPGGGDPLPMPAYSGLLIDVANPSVATVKQACALFAAAAEDASAPEMTGEGGMVGKIFNESGVAVG